MHRHDRNAPDILILDLNLNVYSHVECKLSRVNRETGIYTNTNHAPFEWNSIVSDNGNATNSALLKRALVLCELVIQ